MHKLVIDHDIAFCFVGLNLHFNLKIVLLQFHIDEYLKKFKFHDSIFVEIDEDVLHVKFCLLELRDGFEISNLNLKAFESIRIVIG
jgi:hypothetical protein